MSYSAQTCSITTPKNLKEALHLLDNEPYEPFAGGTDVMVLLEMGLSSKKYFLNIWQLNELKGESTTSDYLTLGALTTYADIRRSAIIQKEFPLLIEAAKVTGAIAIQNRGTLGGNIINASPAADTPPALLVYEADVELVSSKGSRWVPYHEFHTGYKKMNRNSNELLSKVRLPRNTKNTKQYYRKVGTRKAQAISKVCMAALAATDKKGIVTKFRLGMGSVAPVPLRCHKTEKMIENNAIDSTLIQKAKEVLAGEISPIDDIRSTKVYRLKVSQNLLGEFLESLCGTG